MGVRLARRQVAAPLGVLPAGPPAGRAAMVRVVVTVRAGGLHPLEACKAWHLREKEGYSWPETLEELTTVDGETPKVHSARNAVARVSD